MEKINYTLTLEDCNNYARSQSKIPRLKKIIVKNYIKLYSIFIFVMLLLSFFWFGFSVLEISIKHHFTIISVITDKGFPNFFLAQFKNYFVIAIIMSLLLFILLLMKNYIWGGQYIYKMLEGLDLNYEISISEENITKSNKNEISTFNWKTIKDIYDTKFYYLVFTSDVQALIIPKRCFESEKQSKEFYNKIRKYYDDAQKG